MFITNMQAHYAAEFAGQARSVWQDAAHLDLHTSWRRGGKVILLGLKSPRHSSQWPGLNTAHMIPKRVPINYATAMTKLMKQILFQTFESHYLF